MPASAPASGKATAFIENGSPAKAPTPLAAPAIAPAAPAGNAWAKAIKNPTPWLSWGADQRLREEYRNNASTLNKNVPGHELAYQRYRTRLWTTITPLPDVEINTRVVWEWRNYCLPKINDFRDTDMNEALFDTLNVKWKNIGGLPLTATVGRQDILLGNGWLVLDGTPLDGSRTVYFDAARLTYEMKEAKTVIDGIYIDQHRREDYYIEPFNYRYKSEGVDPTTEQDEQGIIMNVANKSIKDTELDGYFIWKQDNNPLPNGDDGNVYAFGTREIHDFSPHWQLRNEWVEEVGNKNAEQFNAGGTNNRLTYFFRDKQDNQLRTGYEFLSERFDPLWGRWPQWSELLGYTWALETKGRPAYWQNLHRIQFGHQFSPINKLTLSTDYHLLFTDGNPVGGSTGFSDSGRFRGQLLTWLAQYRVNEFIAMHVWSEFFFPGDYYSDFRNDPAVFLRYEIVFSF